MKLELLMIRAANTLNIKGRLVETVQKEKMTSEHSIAIEPMEMEITPTSDGTK